MTADQIFQAVLDAMQPAEDIGGPSVPDYIELMQRIATEATERARNAAELL